MQTRMFAMALVLVVASTAGCKGEKGETGLQGERGLQGPPPTEAEIQQAVSAMTNLDVPSLGGRPASGYVNTLTGGRVYEAEQPPLNAAVTVGTVADDATASGGKVRQAAFGNASGRVYAFASSDIGEPLASTTSTIEFRLKVHTNTSSTIVATLGCSAIRAGDTAFTVLAQRTVAPSQFSAADGWKSYYLHCDFVPDDPDQLIWVDYVTGITDFSIDRARISPVVHGFQGFSVYTAGTTKAAGWEQVTFNGLKFNTFDSAYDTSTSRFTAPFAGYYRFSAGGYSPTPTSAVDSRFGIAFLTNGIQDSISGGQQSAVDTPLPCHIQIVHLNKGDIVSVSVYSTATMQLGTSASYSFWFQGEYLGP